MLRLILVLLKGLLVPWTGRWMCGQFYCSVNWLAKLKGAEDDGMMRSSWVENVELGQRLVVHKSTLPDKGKDKYQFHEYHRWQCPQWQRGQPLDEATTSHGISAEKVRLLVPQCRQVSWLLTANRPRQRILGHPKKLRLTWCCLAGWHGPLWTSCLAGWAQSSLAGKAQAVWRLRAPHTAQAHRRAFRRPSRTTSLGPFSSAGSHPNRQDMHHLSLPPWVTGQSLWPRPPKKNVCCLHGDKKGTQQHFWSIQDDSKNDINNDQYGYDPSYISKFSKRNGKVLQWSFCVCGKQSIILKILKWKPIFTNRKKNLFKYFFVLSLSAATFYFTVIVATPSVWTSPLLIQLFQWPESYLWSVHSTGSSASLVLVGKQGQCRSMKLLTYKFIKTVENKKNWPAPIVLYHNISLFCISVFFTHTGNDAENLHEYTRDRLNLQCASVVWAMNPESTVSFYIMS